MSDVRALTLHQPWASLVAVGAKSIETRGWETKYRGRLLIHAGKAKPVDVLPWIVSPNRTQMCSLDTREAHPLPLGAVVASCTLTDCVPIVSWSPLEGPPAWAATSPRCSAPPTRRRSPMADDGVITFRSGPVVVRVLCPDGHVAEEFASDPGTYDTDRLEHWARLAAANADDMHDGARCTTAHRIERSTWTEVPR